MASYGKYEMYFCADCDLVYSDPMRTDPAFYEESADYLFRDTLILDPLKWDYRWDMAEFMKNPPRRGGSLLDVGCGTGSFVKRAIGMGFDAYGIETNERSVRVGREHFGLTSLFPTDLAGFLGGHGDKKFDVVTLFQVIEHLEDPNETMRELSGALKPEAVVAISLPLRDRWPDTSGEGGDCPPHHLTRWSLKAMDNFLRMNGFMIRRHKIEEFSLQNMSVFIYNYVLKLMPSLTMKGSGIQLEAGSVSKESALMLMKRRKLKMDLVNVFGIPLWLILKLLGAKGPNLYVEAVRQ